MLTPFTNELADTSTGCYGGFYTYITQGALRPVRPLNVTNFGLECRIL